MRFPATLPTPSNVGPLLGSPVYSSEYDTLKWNFLIVLFLETPWHILISEAFYVLIIATVLLVNKSIDYDS
jgi:hypothetical protein